MMVSATFLAGGIAGKPQAMGLNFNNTKTATLELDIVDDNVVEEDGTIRVALLADDANPIKYTIAGGSSKIGLQLRCRIMTLQQLLR